MKRILLSLALVVALAGIAGAQSTDQFGAFVRGAMRQAMPATAECANVQYIPAANCEYKNSNLDFKIMWNNDVVNTVIQQLNRSDETTVMVAKADEFYSSFGFPKADVHECMRSGYFSNFDPTTQNVIIGNGKTVVIKNKQWVLECRFNPENTTFEFHMYVNTAF